SPALEPPGEDLPFEDPRLPLEPDARPRLQLLTGMDQGIEEAAFRCRTVHSADNLRLSRPEQQALDRATRWNPAAEEPRRNDAGVVDHQNISGAQKLRQLPNDFVASRTGPALEHEQAGRAAWEGSLRDQLIGQDEVEVGDSHGTESAQLDRVG